MTSSTPDDARVGTATVSAPPERVRATASPASAEARTRLVFDSAAILLGSIPFVRVAELLPVLLVTVTALACAGLYRHRISVTVLDDVPRIIVAVSAAATTAVLGAGMLVDVGIFDAASAPRRFPALWWAVVVFGALVAGRTAACSYIRNARRRRGGAPTLIVGSGEVAAFLVRVLGRRPEYGLTPVGFVCASPGLSSGVPVLADSHADIEAVVRRHEVENIVIAFDQTPDAELVDVLLGWSMPGCRILCVPRFFEVHPIGNAAGDIQGMPLVWMRRGVHVGPRRFAKRALDVAVSGAALLLLAPLIGLCAAIVRLEGRPALFRQVRIGRNGRPFTLFKLSSMRPADHSEADTRWNISADPRISRFGQFLRRAAIDELPQLYNVLRGDMSLVGPRPERPYFVNEFQLQHRNYPYRHRVTVGLTGLAQVHGLRGDTSIAERVLLDNAYIENWSLWFDMKIVLRTATCVLRDVIG